MFSTQTKDFFLRLKLEYCFIILSLEVLFEGYLRPRIASKHTSMGIRADLLNELPSNFECCTSNVVELIR